LLEPAKKPGSRKVARPTPPAPESIQQALLDLQKRGFNRLYQAGRVHEFSSPETLLDLDFSQPIYVLVDRLAVSPEIRSRLADSVEICFREGKGEAILEFLPPEAPTEMPPETNVAPDSTPRLVFSDRFEC